MPLSGRDSGVAEPLRRTRCTDVGGVGKLIVLVQPAALWAADQNRLTLLINGDLLYVTEQHVGIRAAVVTAPFLHVRNVARQTSSHAAVRKSIPTATGGETMAE
jgi:hypothetical protein